MSCGTPPTTGTSTPEAPSGSWRWSSVRRGSSGTPIRTRLSCVRPWSGPVNRPDRASYAGSRRSAATGSAMRRSEAAAAAGGGATGAAVRTGAHRLRNAALGRRGDPAVEHRAGLRTTPYAPTWPGWPPGTSGCTVSRARAFPGRPRPAGAAPSRICTAPYGQGPDRCADRTGSRSASVLVLLRTRVAHSRPFPLSRAM